MKDQFKVNYSPPTVRDQLAQNRSGSIGTNPLKTLRILDLTGDDVTDAAIDMQKALPDLQTVYLRDAKTTAAGRKALQAALPKLRLDP